MDLDLAVRWFLVLSLTCLFDCRLCLLELLFGDLVSLFAWCVLGVLCGCFLWWF